MAESKAIAQQVGARIRQLRTERGMSLEKLALECGMNPAFLGHVERGLRCPTVYTLARVCGAWQTLLIHRDPKHTDNQLLQLEQAIREPTSALGGEERRFFYEPNWKHSAAAGGIVPDSGIAAL